MREAEPKSILVVVGRIFPVPPEAGTPRPFHLLTRLARRADLHLVATLAESPAEWRAFLEQPALAGVFRSARAVHRRPHGSFLGRARTLFSGRAFFDLAYVDGPALARSHALAREVARGPGGAVVYAWGQDALQLVPPSAHRATLLDLVDAPVLALSRRIASDRRLSLRDQVVLRAALLALRRFERDVLTRVGGVSLNSSADIASLRAVHPDAPIAHVIDGGDTEYFARENAPGEVETPNELAFFGNLSFPPNADAAFELVEHILPLVRQKRPDAKAVVIGPNPPPRLARLADGRNVEVTGFVPDVRPYLARAAVVVSPLRFGAGMKNKLQAGLAMGKAMVASTVTCEGFDRLVPGVHALVADGAEASARAILELLADPARRAALGTAGRALIFDHYGWDSAVSVLWENLRHLAPWTGDGDDSSAVDA